jgi:hypothetical protein
MFVLPLLAVGITAVAAPSTPGKPAESEVRMTGFRAVDLFDIALRAEQAGKMDVAERAYEALAHDPDVEVRTEARFRHAMLLKLIHRDREAAVLLRAILDDKPDAARVRLELGAALARLGYVKAARRELRNAEASGLPKEIALIVDQYSLALRSLRPFGGSLEIGLAPDTNINRATRSQTLDTVIAPFQLSDDARAKSGVGLNICAQIFARHWLNPRIALEARLSSHSSFYRENQFDDLLYGGQLGMELRLGKNAIAPTFGRNWRRFGQKAYSITDTAAVDWQRSVGRTGLTDVRLSTGRADYRVNDLQDGRIHSADLSFERSLSGTFGGAVTLSGQRQTARDAAYAAWSGGASLLAWKETRRMSLFASVAARRLRADARIFLYPAKREEWFTSASVGATFRQLAIRDFAPLVRVTYERNASTLTLYDYHRLSATFGITRAF